jgi:hypothetical protein
MRLGAWSGLCIKPVHGRPEHCTAIIAHTKTFDVHIEAL